MSLTYDQFLDQKRKAHIVTGFEANINSEHLFPFQNYVVNEALFHGKYGVFSGTGTGKTRMQITWASQVAYYTRKPVLILAPLAVSGQTIQEGLDINIEVRKLTEAPEPECIYIINYDQLENISDLIHLFGGIALDEASILKNHEGAYRNKIIELFRFTQFKSVWTATPSPNDPMEIGNYAEFLDVMSRNEMLSMYFVHDGGETAKWRLKGHSKKIFWEWVSSWAKMFSNPKDIGFEQGGYDLPKLNLIEHKIVTENRNKGQLFNGIAVSATNFNQELRLTKVQRLEEVVSIVKSRPGENFLIWVKHDAEGEYLRKLLPDAVEVTGSDKPEIKEQRLLGFAKNAFPILITKMKIAAWGLNYQNCGNHIFASPDFSFEMVFQAIRRSLRFGRLLPVNAWILTTDTMTNVIKTFYRKQAAHEEMQHQMIEASKSKVQKKEKIKREYMQVKCDNFDIRLGDCVQLIKDIPDESIGFSVFSPPFAELYTYSDELEDMGNSKNYNEFLFAFKYLVKDLYRVLWSGRNIAVHCMDLPIQKGKEGYIGLRDFSNMIRESFEAEGFIYHSRVTIWKDPVTEMQRTKALGLLHKQVKKDAAMSRVGLPDYILVFRKPGEHEHPVKCDIPVDLWQKYASPVWYDIDYGKTLNGRSAREEQDEKHICPLQLETIERCIHLWTNKGDTILTPFMGIGSEVFQALKMKRKGVGFELKKSYFEVAAKNCKAAEQENAQKLLFD